MCWFLFGQTIPVYQQNSSFQPSSIEVNDDALYTCKKYSYNVQMYNYYYYNNYIMCVANCCVHVHDLNPTRGSSFEK